jgi:hypothetical protein
MKKLLAFLLFFTMLSCAKPETPVVQPAAYSADAFQRDVANVTVIVRDGKGSYLGTGVVVFQDKEKALVATAAHVVEDENLDIAFLENVRPGQVSISTEPGIKLIKYDRILDLAVMEVKPVFLAVAKMYNFETLSRLKLYTRCYSLGFPRIGPGVPVPSPHMTDGFISQFDPHLMFSSQVYYGNSGGGIFVQDGKDFFLVGIVHRIFAKDAEHRYDFVAAGSSPRLLIAFLE